MRKTVFDKNKAMSLGITWEVLRVKVNYGLSLGEMVEAGKYDWTNNNINATNFPKNRNGKFDLNIYLLCFNKFMDYEPIPSVLEECGLVEGDLPILLSVGAEYPEKQIEFPIVQTGSVWPDLQRGGRRGVYLRRGKRERGLAFIWLEHGFPGYYRFVAVEKFIL